MLLQQLSPARVREFGILDPAAVAEALSAFLSGSRGSGSADGLWFLLQLQQWAGRWLKLPAGAASDARQAIGAA